MQKIGQITPYNQMFKGIYCGLEASLRPALMLLLALQFGCANGCLKGQVNITLADCRPGQARVVYNCETPPQVQATNVSLDPLVRPGDSENIPFTVANGARNLTTVSVAISYDGGKTFSDETSLATSANNWSYQIPSNALATTNAVLRITATDTVGVKTQKVSPSFQIVSSIDLLAGALDVSGLADGDAKSSRFFWPTTLAGDGTYLYSIDVQACVLRRTNLSNGSTQTIVGQPYICGNLDGTGSGATLWGFGASFGVLGSYLYIADGNYHIMRRVVIDSNSPQFGQITTVAGSTLITVPTNGVGTSAGIGQPYGMTTDGTYLYYAERSASIVQRYDPSSTAVTTVAGIKNTTGHIDGLLGTGRMNGPISLACDGSNLYIADANNSAVRKLNLSNNNLSTLANTAYVSGMVDGVASAARFNDPHDVVTDGSYVYITEAFMHTIRKIDANTGATTTIAGQTGISGYANGALGTSLFNGPSGLYLNNGTLYVTDFYNAAIRTISTSTNVVQTLTSAFNTTGVISGATSILHNSPTVGKFNRVFGLTTLDGQTFYMVDFNMHSVRKLDLSAGKMTTVAGNVGNPGTADGAALNAQFNSPHAITQVGSKLYVADQANCTIRQVDLSAQTVTTIAGIPTSCGHITNVGGLTAKLSAPVGVVSDGTNLYVADQNNNMIRSIAINSPWNVTDLAGSTVAGSQDGIGVAAGFKSPKSVALSPDNSSLYVADGSNCTVRKIIIASGQTSTIAGVAGSCTAVDGALGTNKLAGPLAVATDGSNVYILDNARIRVLNLASGVVTTTWGGGPTTLFNDAAGLTANTAQANSLLYLSGKLYTTTNSAGVFSFNTSTLQRNLIAGGASNSHLLNIYANGNMDGPLTEYFPRYGGAAASDGKQLYVFDSDNYCIRKLNFDGSSETNFAGTCGTAGVQDGQGSAAGFSSAMGMVSDGSSYLYVADSYNHAIRRVAFNDGTVTTIAGSLGTYGSADGTGSSALFNQPEGITINGTDLYVSEVGNQTIRKVSLSSTNYGAVVTVAGVALTPGYLDAVGTSANFNTPGGMVVFNNKLYVADTGNHAIRVVDLGNNYSVSTWAGLGQTAGYVDGSGSSARFSGPFGLTTDGTSLYVGDANNGVIRKANLSSGVVTTFAGQARMIRDDADGNVSTTAIFSKVPFYQSGVGLFLLHNNNLKLMH